MGKSVTNEKKHGAYRDSEKGRCYNSPLLDPSSDGERLRFSPIEEDGCSHFVTKKSQDGDEVGRAQKPGQDFPKRVTIDGVEGLGHVNEGH